MSTLRDFQFTLQLKIEEIRQRDELIETLSEELICRESKVRQLERELRQTNTLLLKAKREAIDMQKSIEKLQDKILEKESAPHTSGSGSFYATTYVSPSRSRLQRHRAKLMKESLNGRNEHRGHHLSVSTNSSAETTPRRMRSSSSGTEANEANANGIELMPLLEDCGPQAVLVDPQTISITVQPTVFGS